MVFASFTDNAIGKVVLAEQQPEPEPKPESQKLCKDVDSVKMLPCSKAVCQDKAIGKLSKCAAWSAAASTEAILLLYILAILFSWMCA